MMLPDKPLKTAPDDGYNPAFLNAWTTDLGEVAARIGSIDTIRRTGKVAYLDDFAVNKSWVLSTSGVAGIVATPALRDWGSMRITPIAASPFNAAIAKNFPTFTSTKLGMEITVTPSGGGSGVYTFDMFFMRNLGGAQYVGGIRNDFINGLIQYQDNTGAWITAFTYNPPALGFPTWMNLKLTFDFTSPGAPVTTRISYNNQEKDIFSGMRNAGGTTGEFTEIEFVVTDNSGGQHSVYLQDFILTIDEA